MEPLHLGNQSFSGILIEDVVVYLYVSLLVIIIDSTLQYHFSSCLDHSHYFARTKLFEKYKNAAGLQTDSHLPIWDCTLAGPTYTLLEQPPENTEGLQLI